MESFFNSVSAVVVVLLMMAVGYLMGRMGWMKPEHKGVLTKLMINVAVPCMCIYSMLSNVSRDFILQSGVYLAIPFCSAGAVLLLAVLLARLLKLPRRRMGPFIVMCLCSNVIFAGYPMSMELFGEVSIPYIMYQFVVTTIMFQSVGIGVLAYSGREDGKGFFSMEGLKMILKNPPFVALFVAIALVLLEVKLPSPIMNFCKYMNGIVSPVGLIYAGFVIYEIGFKDIRLERGLPTVMLVRFVVAPGLCILFSRLFGVTGLGLEVFAVLVAMPVMIQTIIMSAALGADEHYCAKGTLLTTLASFVVIPVLMALI